eukprot:g11980.t1
MLLASGSPKTIYIDDDDDLQSDCLDEVEPGDTCYLEEGNYYQDGLTATHGTADARITITGDSGACIRGSGDRDRALQIAHDYYTVEDICFYGRHDDDDHVSTAIYVLGGDTKTTKNGVTSSVTGLRLYNLDISNFGGECIHLRYFVTHAEVTGCNIERCGVDYFENGDGGKVGEGVYIGTSLDQLDDGETPEPKLRSDSESDDDVEADVCAYNWIHHNTIRTYGNECVDVKEGSCYNLIEHNVCEEQRDPESGCFGMRGSDNTVRWNDISDCEGAGVRLGGEDGYGEGNHVYGNTIRDCEYAAFKVMAPNQGTVCENDISGVDYVSGGSDDQDQEQFTEEAATGSCSSYYPGDIGDLGTHTGRATRQAPAVLLLCGPLVVLLSGLFLARRDRFERVLWEAAATAVTKEEKAATAVAALGVRGLRSFGIGWTTALTGRRVPPPPPPPGTRAASGPSSSIVKAARFAGER